MTIEITTISTQVLTFDKFPRLTFYVFRGLGISKETIACKIYYSATKHTVSITQLGAGHYDSALRIK